MSNNTTLFTAPVPDKLFNKGNVLFIALLLLATFIALSPSLSAGFVDWEDPANLLENEQLKEPLSWSGIGQIFTSGVNGNYNPLPILTFALEKKIFAPVPEQAPFIFHFTNLWMHMLCTILVFVLFLKLGVNSVGAFFGALLFGIHPMRVESVAWVAERKDVLYGIFYVATLICYINFTSGTRRSNAWFLAALLLSLLSYLSKIQAVSLPLSMVAIDIYLGKKWTLPKMLLWEKFPWWLLSLSFGVGGMLLLKKEGYLDTAAPLSDYGYTLVDNLAAGAYAYANYLVKWVYPYKMTHFYPYPIHLPAIAYALLVLIPLAAVGFVIWATKKKHTFLLFGWVFFTINIIFLLQVIPVGSAFQADRFTYIAYIGLFFIVAVALQKFNSRFPKWIKPSYALLTAYCVLLTATTYVQAGTWNNTLSMCEHNIACYPDSYYGYNQAGIMYLRQSFAPGRSDEKKLRLIQNSEDYFLKAYMYDSLSGNPSPALTSDICQNLGIINGLVGENEKAIHYFSVALLLTPHSVETIKNRAYQYFLNKEFVLAIADYNHAIQVDPQNDNLYYLRANCYYSQRDLDNAKKDLDKAVALGSRDPNCYIARSVIHRANNNISEAREDAQHAKELGADVPDIYFQ